MLEDESTNPEREGLKIDVRKLRLFNKMAKQGGDTVAENLQQMTGIDARMEITKINFIDLPDIQSHVGDANKVGISVELVEAPHGYILMLLDADSAKGLTDRMVGGQIADADSESGLSDMEKSAIQEIGNIMTSGFIDGWANVLETTIDISTPQFAFGSPSGMVDDLVGSSPDEIAVLFDSQVHAPDADVEMTIYLFPDLEELVGLMQQIEL